MRTDNSRELDLPRVDLRLQLRGHSALELARLHDPEINVLGRIGRVDNDRLLGRFIGHQVGIVVALPGPWRGQQGTGKQVPWGNPYGGNIHIGIDCTCMALICRAGACTLALTGWNLTDDQTALVRHMDMRDCEC